MRIVSARLRIQDFSGTRKISIEGGLARGRVRSRSGFSLIELLVVIVIIAILAALLLPVLSRAKANAQTTDCLNNLKQLQIAWIQYEADNYDQFPLNIARTISGNPENLTNSWVLGNAQLDRDPSDITSGTLFLFSKSAALYHCPADKSTVQGGGPPRLRSYSVEGWLGSDFQVYGLVWPNMGTVPPNYTFKTKASLINSPGPADVFVFIDEQEQSINDGVFIISGPPDQTLWVDLPADRHRQGCNLSFLDGHAVSHHWSASKIFNGHLITGRDALDLQDQNWLRDRLPTN